MSEKLEEKKELSPLEKKLRQLRAEARALSATGKPERMARYKVELRAKLPAILDDIIKTAGEDGDFWACSASNYAKLEYRSDGREADVILADLLRSEGLSSINSSIGGSWISLHLPEPE